MWGGLYEEEKVLIAVPSLDVSDGRRHRDQRPKSQPLPCVYLGKRQRCQERPVAEPDPQG